MGVDEAMSEAKSVYIVTKGQYYDYGIDSVFSKKEEADRYAAELAHTTRELVRVEEWAIDTMAEMVARKCWHVNLDISTGQFCLYGFSRGEDYRESTELAKPEQRSGDFNAAGSLHWANVGATSFVSPEHAKKLAVERRQEIL